MVVALQMQSTCLSFTATPSPPQQAHLQMSATAKHTGIDSCNHTEAEAQRSHTEAEAQRQRQRHRTGTRRDAQGQRGRGRSRCFRVGSTFVCAFTCSRSLLVQDNSAMMFLRDTQKNETSWWSSARGALSLFWSLVRYVEQYLFVIRNEGVTCRDKHSRTATTRRCCTDRALYAEHVAGASNPQRGTCTCTPTWHFVPCCCLMRDLAMNFVAHDYFCNRHSSLLLSACESTT